MARFSLLIFGLMATAVLSAQEGGLVDPADEVQQTIGRYQIAFSFEGLVFLDTSTGELWLKDGRGRWHGIDSPVREKRPTPTAERKPVTLVLPEVGETMPMVQRERRAVPGSSETLWVQLGDITGGQLFVEVIDLNDRLLVDRTSLKDKEFVRFKVGQRDVYLQVVEMVNNLLGEDICQVRLSFSKPVIEHEKNDAVENVIE